MPDKEPEEGGRVSKLSGISIKDFRVFATGSAGRGPEGGGEIGGGGLVEGRCGMAEVMVVVVVVDICRCVSMLQPSVAASRPQIFGDVLAPLVGVRIAGLLGTFTCSETPLVLPRRSSVVPHKAGRNVEQSIIVMPASDC